MSEDALICSFCSKGRKDVTKMIVGAKKIAICNECVKLCVEILDEDIVKNRKEKLQAGDKNILNPVVIKEHLDQYVIGQDQAKTVLSVAVANHYKRIVQPPIDFELDKSNVMVLGATGAGKTLMARTIAKYLDVPFAIADATTLTESGYVGEDVENVVQKLYANAKGDIEKTEKGIIFIDEIDKICRKGENTSLTRDVSGEGVQQALLKLMEGTVASVPPQGGRKHPQQEFLQVDTTNILFICGGAFSGLDQVIKHRQKGTAIGFGADVRSDEDSKIGDILKNLQPEDLVKYGLIPEFVGRLPVIATLEDLDEESLIKILTEPKNALTKQYQSLFKMEKVDLEFRKDALKSIAKLAISRKTGARGLRSILETILMDTMFDLPSHENLQEVIISPETVESGKLPIMVHSDKKKDLGAQA